MERRQVPRLDPVMLNSLLTDFSVHNYSVIEILTAVAIFRILTLYAAAFAMKAFGLRLLRGFGLTLEAEPRNQPKKALSVRRRPKKNHAA